MSVREKRLRRGSLCSDEIVLDGAHPLELPVDDLGATPPPGFSAAGSCNADGPTLCGDDAQPTAGKRPRKGTRSRNRLVQGRMPPVGKPSFIILRRSEWTAVAENPTGCLRTPRAAARRRGCRGSAMVRRSRTTIEAISYRRRSLMKRNSPAWRRSTFVSAARLALAVSVGTLLSSEAPAEEAMRLESPYSFPDTLTRLQTAFEANGIRVFAIIDHQAAAQSVGLNMPPTSVIVYGNPKGGTELMLAAPDFSVELPLRVLIREDDRRKVYVVFDPSGSFEGKHGLPASLASKLAPPEKLIANAISSPSGRP